MPTKPRPSNTTRKPAPKPQSDFPADAPMPGDASTTIDSLVATGGKAQPETATPTKTAPHPLSAEIESVIDRLTKTASDQAMHVTGGSLTGGTARGGESSVRMLNNNGHTISVAARFVPQRLQDGYKFIEGEPTVPRNKRPMQPGGKEPEHPDVPSAAYLSANYRPSAQPTPTVTRLIDAEKLWLMKMNEDRVAYANDDTLDWTCFNELALAIKDKIERNRTY